MFASAAVLTVLLNAPVATEAPPSDVHARAADSGEVAEVQRTQEDLDEMGFMERRAAFSLNDDLHPSIADDLLPFFLGGLCSYVGGPLWLPLLMNDDQPNDYFDEAFLSYLVWAIPLWVGFAIGIIPYVGWLFGVVYCPIALAISLYLMPVNVANAWDRAAKVNGMKGKGSKRKSSEAPPKRNQQPAPQDEDAPAVEVPTNPLSAMAF